MQFWDALIFQLIECFMRAGEIKFPVSNLTFKWLKGIGYFSNDTKHKHPQIYIKLTRFKENNDIERFPC